MNGRIAYRFETPARPARTLYVNLIANYGCVNDCLFCSRPRNKDEIGKENIYEKKTGSSLFLRKAPSVEKVMVAIDEEIKGDDSELAIIGLGEPLIYLPTIVGVIGKIKKRYDIRTRVDTNGLVKCMYENAAMQLRAAGLDEIRISLNAVNESEYNQLCRPKINDAFLNLVSFVSECVGLDIDTHVSFVVGFEKAGLKKRTREEYIAFATSLGVKKENIIPRKYVKPI